MNLQNNSKEMKTIVETFVIEETAELIYDNEKLDKWNELVGELGLEGQTKLVQPERSPIPFMPMNNSLTNILQTLCPRSVQVEDYNVSPIPVEILDLISLSKREAYFQSVEIWYDEKSKDPFCVGITGSWKEVSWYANSVKELEDVEFKSKKEVINAGGKHPYFMEKQKYLLGKWADVKHSFDELKQMATKRFIGERENELKKTIKDAERGLIDLETEAFDRFN